MEGVRDSKVFVNGKVFSMSKCVLKIRRLLHVTRGGADKVVQNICIVRHRRWGLQKC